ncbi:MAG TPA: tetratricopeptide repeat protein [Thermoanaerobaculia bacterium]
MRHKSLVLFILIALLAAAAPPVSAQSWAGRGRLQGEVKDEQGKPIEGAKITLRKGEDRVDPKADGPKTVLTNKHGKWSILGLAGGAWGVLIEKEGYMVSEGQVKVNEFAVAQPINVTLKLPPKEIMQQQQQQDAKASGNAQAKQAIETANAHLQASRFAEARAEYQKALGLLEVDDPTVKVSILRTIARTYFEEKQIDKGIDTLKQVLQIAPDDVETLQTMVNVLVAAGREKEAEAYVAKLPQGTTVDPNSLLNLGIKLFNEKNLQGALEKFDRVVKENPNIAEAYYFRGLTYLGLNKAAEAKADFQKLVELDPNSQYAAEAKEFIKSL